MSRGVLGRGDQAIKNMGSIEDGTSNTLAISKSLCGNGSGNEQRNAKRDTLNIGVMTNGPPPTGATPQDCLNEIGSNKEFKTASLFAYDRKGQRWCHAGIGYSGFVTVLPPNAPSCYDYNDNASNTYALERIGYTTAGSNHTGGVNVGMVDGSVHFVSDTINWTTNATSNVTISTSTKIRWFGIRRLGCRRFGQRQ